MRLLLPILLFTLPALGGEPTQEPAKESDRGSPARLLVMALALR